MQVQKLLLGAWILSDLAILLNFPPAKILEVKHTRIHTKILLQYFNLLVKYPQAIASLDVVLAPISVPFATKPATLDSTRTYGLRVRKIPPHRSPSLIPYRSPTNRPSVSIRQRWNSPCCSGYFFFCRRRGLSKSHLAPGTLTIGYPLEQDAALGGQKTPHGERCSELGGVDRESHEWLMNYIS